MTAWRPFPRYTGGTCTVVKMTRARPRIGPQRVINVSSSRRRRAKPTKRGESPVSVGCILYCYYIDTDGGGSRLHEEFSFHTWRLLTVKSTATAAARPCVCKLFVRRIYNLAPDQRRFILCHTRARIHRNVHKHEHRHTDTHALYSRFYIISPKQTQYTRASRTKIFVQDDVNGP